MARATLGILGIHSLELAVRRAEPWLSFLTRGFGFQLVASTTGRQVEATGTRRRLLRCGDIRIVLAEAIHGGSEIRNYLERHPEGISTVRFRVDDADQAEKMLIERHATPTGTVRTENFDNSTWRETVIATPLGIVNFAFVQHDAVDSNLMPGMEPAGRFDKSHNPAGLVGLDHLTANVRTMMPVLAFFEHVLGFERFWDVSFHTEDIRPGVGTGLKSVVMWDESSGVKLATNEPLRPRYHASQVAACLDANRGPGVHHFAFNVSDILTAVDVALDADVSLLPMPPAYYADLPKRVTSQGIKGFTTPIDELARRNILLDGDATGHLLQAFCRDQSEQHEDAGPLVIELTQRSGAKGFGEGNFRALFEAMTKENGA
ncbi:MAG: VOC family protein [Phycisphaerales bacterium]|nr:VOC family protein [Phycisphaerales bacterium]